MHVKKMYNIDDSIKLFASFDSNLEHIHSFMTSPTSRLMFIKRKLMRLCPRWINTSVSSEEKLLFIERLFIPVYKHYLPLILKEKVKTNTTDIDKIVNGIVNKIVTNYTNKEINCMTLPLNHTSNLSQVTDKIKNFNDVLGFHQIANIINDFHMLMQLCDKRMSYNQLLMVFSLRNIYYINLINQCHIFTKESILYKLFSKQNKPLYNPTKDPSPEAQRHIVVGTEDLINEYITSNLYEELIDLSYKLSSNSGNKKDLKDCITATSKHLNHDIPKKSFPQNIKLIKFTSFEELIAFNLHEIIEQQLFIQKCQVHDCNCYFISTSVEPQYCKYHKKKNGTVNKHYLHTINSHPEYAIIFEKFCNTLYQRVHRTSDKEKKRSPKSKF